MEPKGELVVAEGVWAVDEVCWQLMRVSGCPGGVLADAKGAQVVAEGTECMRDFWSLEVHWWLLKQQYEGRCGSAFGQRGFGGLSEC